MPVCMWKRFVINGHLDNHVFLVHSLYMCIYVHLHVQVCIFLLYVFSTSAVLCLHMQLVCVLLFNSPCTSENSQQSVYVHVYIQTEAWFQFIVSITVLNKLGKCIM